MGPRKTLPDIITWENSGCKAKFVCGQKFTNQKRRKGRNPSAGLDQNPRRGRAAPLKTCTKMQVGRLRLALPLPTSRHLRRGPGGLRTTARVGRPVLKMWVLTGQGHVVRTRQGNLLRLSRRAQRANSEAQGKPKRGRRTRGGFHVVGGVRTALCAGEA